MTVSAKSRSVFPILDSKRSRTVKGTVALENKSGFDEQVAAVTGQSIGAVRRIKRIANAFTDEELEVFTQMCVGVPDITTIAKIKDEGRRGEVVSLLAAGMAVEDAIKEAMKDQGPIRHSDKSKARSEAKAPAVAQEQPDRSDEEWFAGYVGKCAAKLKHSEKFKRDTILFKTIYELLPSFRVKRNRKKLMEIAKNASGGGVLEYLLDSFVSRIDLLSIAPPHLWTVCRKCKGQGETATGQKCRNCSGGGYHLSFLDPS